MAKNIPNQLPLADELNHSADSDDHPLSAQNGHTFHRANNNNKIESVETVKIPDVKVSNIIGKHRELIIENGYCLII